MTQNKKAELQRKLSMAQVAKPPAGLLDRLKADIPDNLMSVEPDRTRLSRSMSFTLRIAASVILLVTSAFLGVKLLSRGELSQIELASDSQPKVAAPVAAAETVTMTAPAPATPPTEEIALSAPVAADAKRSEAKDEKRTALNVVHPAAKEDREDAPAADSTRIGGVAGGAIGGVVAQPLKAAAVPDKAPPPTPDPAPIPVADAVSAAAEPPAMRQAVAVTSETAAVGRRSADLQKSRPAAEFGVAAPRKLFGLSIDPSEFGRLKRMIETGQKPAAASVNIIALVNHFAGPAQPRRADVRLQVEGSRAPLAAQNGMVIIRYTIDTARLDARNRSMPTLGAAAALEIQLNKEVIDSYRILAGGTSLNATEQTLVPNVSATGLIEVRLKPGAAERQNVATIRLKYRSSKTGDEVVLVDSVNVRELHRSWLAASRRHRLATLGAVWGESLNGPPPAEDVARTAKELATEEPGDARAKDLAAAATASSRLRSSGPTGSER